MLPIIDLHSILSLLLYSILNTNIIHATLSIDCQLFVDLAFQPNSTKSILGIVRLQPSPDPTAVDCAHVCLRSPLCRSAVFERQQMFCTLYNETATMSGRLLTNSTGTFTTIVTERSPAGLIHVPNTIIVYAIWNTTAGQNSVPATSGRDYPGQYWYQHSPNNAFDGNWSSGFCSYGENVAAVSSDLGGLNTGVYLTLPGDPIQLEGFRFVRGDYPLAHDPLKLTIEGSNLMGSALTLGASWTLIYNGTAGLDVFPGYNKPGIKQTLPNNSLRFSSYRFLMTEHRSDVNCISYTEIELYQL